MTPSTTLLIVGRGGIVVSDTEHDTLDSRKRWHCSTPFAAMALRTNRPFLHLSHLIRSFDCYRSIELVSLCLLLYCQDCTIMFVPFCLDC